MGKEGSFVHQVFLCLAVGVLCASASDLVPVYMWQTTPTRGLFPAITHVTPETFTEILLQKQQHSKRVIVFAEENISPEDFYNKDNFVELAKLADQTLVTYLPTVVRPLDGIKAAVPEIRSMSIDEVISNPTALESQDNLIISLNDAQDDETRDEMLRRHSKIIAEAYEKIAANANDGVLAIYTGAHASWSIPDESRILSRSRRAADDDVTPIKTAHFLIYYNNHFTLFKEEKITNLTISKVEEVDKKEGDVVKGEIVFTVTGGTVKFPYVFVDSYMIMQNITYGDDVFDTNFYTPAGFSYSCSSNYSLKVIDAATYLYLPTFQLQYFGNMTDDVKFDDSYDCIGFTSVPIWSGLFVTLILAMIMSWGLTMIMDIRTMDRFDDPKGKTISVNVSE